MGDETLEDKVNAEKSENRFSVWDSMVAAYSSSKSIKMLFESLSAGWSYLDSIAASSILYLGLKTIGIGTKYMAKLIRNPFKNYSITKFLRENMKFYNPLATPRPTGIGAMLSTTTYATGF